jgi:molybdopterin/thiamine biosynthesis adenylyltransferase
MPVGALVFSADAVAGDIWLADGSRVPLERLNVVGRRRTVLTPAPLLVTTADPMYDRQSRLFGDRGQAILKRQKVAVIGLGGGGCLVSQQLAHLGVGELLLIDPDRVEETNLPRIVGARRWEAFPWLTRDARPDWVQRIGRSLSAPKVRVAKRVARRASRSTKVTTVRGSVEDTKIAAMLRDYDQIFLAADSTVARHIINAVAHQYLIPMTQIGAKVTVTRDGQITDVFSISRSSTPGAGCLWCNELIDQDRLRTEATPAEQLERQRYVDDVNVPVPSVITLNAVSAAAAVNDWLMCVTGLTEDTFETEWLQFDARSGEQQLELPRRDAGCRECGTRRFGRGDGLRLPTRLTK